MKRTLSIIGLCMATMVPAVPGLQAQDHLVPGGDMLDISDYQIALHKVFQDDIGSRLWLLRTLVLPSWGSEYVTGLASDSSGYFIFSEVPDSSIVAASWRYIPCPPPDEREGRILEEDGTCRKQDFTNSYSLGTTVRQVPVDSATAELLMDTWHEMLLESRYPREATLNLDGVSYYFYANLYPRGPLSAHAWSPDTNSTPGRLVELHGDIFRATQAPPADQTRLLDSLRVHTSRLMRDLLEAGGRPPIRQYAVRMLAGCTDKEVVATFQDTNYCWQTELDGDPDPEVLTARQSGSSYRYRLHDVRPGGASRSVPVLPVALLYAHWSNPPDSGSTSGAFHALDPWDIGDIFAVRRGDRYELSGIRTFSIGSERQQRELGLEPGTVLILFRGLTFHNSYRDPLEIPVQVERLTFDQLFEQ